MRHRLSRVPVLLAVLAGLAWAGIGPAAHAIPTASDDTTYAAFGRVFPDPHGCVRGLPGKSPYAKGAVCAAQFTQWDEALAGMKYLQQRFPRYLKLIDLYEAYKNDPAFAGEDLRSAGLPKEDMTRDKRDLYVVKITDARSNIAEPARKHFVYSLSIHGIERAGLEGGLRTAEDLVTWAACERDSTSAPSCASEGPFPKRILEPTNSGPTAGEVLRRSVIYFVFSNPDGWHRGEVSTGGVFFQRYNGNGMDVNRDFPTRGYTEPLYTPWSEPESRGYSRYLLYEKARTAAGKFDGAIDLHGMLTARSFSFTLLGSGQRDYRKNAITVDTAITTFRDSEKRLSWSSMIAPASNCPGSVEVPVEGGNVPMCSDQWGTVWDTINYQVTGSFGDWSDSSLGLNAVGIDNEMALSHLAPDDVFDPDLEQLHIDGNKGLVYAQIAALLDEKPVTFHPEGRIAYVFDPARIATFYDLRVANPLSHLPVQDAIDKLDPNGIQDLAFDVLGPKDGRYNGGLVIEGTYANARGISPQGATDNYGGSPIPNSTGQVILDYCGAASHPGDTAGCHEVARYFNQSGLYAQAGIRIDLAEPVPGPYRLRADDARLLPTSYHISFTKGRPSGTPQLPFDASRMDFFTDLNKYTPAGAKLQPVTVRQILSNPKGLDAYDTIVAATAFMPQGPAAGTVAYAKALREYVLNGGNLVLTDGALAALPSLTSKIKASDVTRGVFYAGWMDFDSGGSATYSDPLARDVNKEGTAEGSAQIGNDTFLHRHQTYEPVPIGYYNSPDGSGNADCSSDKCDAPSWVVSPAAWSAAGGRAVARTLVDQNETPGSDQKTTLGVSLGEMKLGKGTVRIAGSLLPNPTTKNYHPYGLSSYAVTYTGYQVFENLVRYRRAGSIAPAVLGERRTGGRLPSTGVGESLPAAFVLLSAAASMAAWTRGKRGRA
jgi:Zinc carboxypeptidase